MTTHVASWTPDVNDRRDALARLWRAGSVSVSDLVSLLTGGDEAATLNVDHPKHFEARLYLDNLCRAGCITRLGPELDMPEGFGWHYAPVYESDAWPQELERAWPACPNCLDVGARASRVGGVTVLACVWCSHRARLSDWDAANHERNEARINVIVPGRVWRPKKPDNSTQTETPKDPNPWDKCPKCKSRDVAITALDGVVSCVKCGQLARAVNRVFGIPTSDDEAKKLAAELAAAVAPPPPVVAPEVKPLVTSTPLVTPAPANEAAPAARHGPAVVKAQPRASPEAKAAEARPAPQPPPPPASPSPKPPPGAVQLAIEGLGPPPSFAQAAGGRRRR
jgi:Zn ribbon nucleic-acid-binding protein